MHALSLRGLPDEVYDRLRQWARRNHRSLHEQIKTILAQESELIAGAPSDPLKWRRRLKGRRWGDVVSFIRKERLR